MKTGESRYIGILDTTLREGEQTPGVIFSIEQKVEIAHLLDDFGVDIIEVGHPVVSPAIRKAVQRLCDEGLRAEKLAHSRAIRSDILEAKRCGADWVGIYYCVTDQRLQDNNKSELDAIGLITDSIKYAKDFGLKVRYTPEDTTRSPIDRVLRVANAAIEAGADRISVADTAGWMLPHEMYDFILHLKEGLEKAVPLHVHCHNDLGMAVANTLAAINAGVYMADVTINGLGERAGIASLHEVCSALKLRYELANQWKMDYIPHMSEIIARYSGKPISDQEPIVGKDAFTHCAGTHVRDELMRTGHYDSGICAMVGRKRDIAISRMSGKAAIGYKLESLGLETS
ncbi:2-isopropylmalate synthase, partial [Candidatus Woesearchaeota archaeon]|nr:2-isopropylmalate synthase [Candidatus Woesearchaeota archaeon]